MLLGLMVVRQPLTMPQTSDPGTSNSMKPTALEKEAERCRRLALEYLSRPETPFLLRVAREFDRLQRARREPAVDLAEEAYAPVFGW
jgi:hypothetical protein